MHTALRNWSTTIPIFIHWNMHPGVIGACKGYWLCLYLKQIFQFSWRTVLKYSDKFKSINVSSWVLACPLKFLNLWNMQLVVYASLRNISHRSYRMKNFLQISRNSSKYQIAVLNEIKVNLPDRMILWNSILWIFNFFLLVITPIF